MSWLPESSRHARRRPDSIGQWLKKGCQLCAILGVKHIKRHVTGGRVPPFPGFASPVFATICEVANIKRHVTKTVHARGADPCLLYLKRVHDAGLLAGVSTHMPDVVDAIESKGWELDYYMTCVYERHRSDQELKKLLGRVPLPPHKVYLSEDPPRMFQSIRNTKRPCLAFKILAAGRLSERNDLVERAFRETFAGIKPIDGAIVGIYDRYTDQPGEDAALVRKYGSNQRAQVKPDHGSNGGRGIPVAVDSASNNPQSTAGGGAVGGCLAELGDAAVGVAVAWWRRTTRRPSRRKRPGWAFPRRKREHLPRATAIHHSHRGHRDHREVIARSSSRGN